jgi:hypothetical protein
VPFSTQVIVDADLTATGWEIVVRVDAESLECAWSDIPELDTITEDVGRAVVETILAMEREADA